MAGGDAALVADRLDELLAGIATNTAPPWVDLPIKDSVGRILTRLKSAGVQQVTASSTSDQWQTQQVIRLEATDPTVWLVDLEREEHRVSMADVLDKVDLRARRFRVRDDVGNDVTLEDVVDVDSAAQLIGRRVVASGTAERSHGRLLRIVEPTLALERIPTEWSGPCKDGPPTGGIPREHGVSGVDAEEVDAFLAELHG